MSLFTPLSHDQFRREWEFITRGDPRVLGWLEAAASAADDADRANWARHLQILNHFHESREEGLIKLAAMMQVEAFASVCNRMALEAEKGIEKITFSREGMDAKTFLRFEEALDKLRTRPDYYRRRVRDAKKMAIGIWENAAEGAAARSGWGTLQRSEAEWFEEATSAQKLVQD